MSERLKGKVAIITGGASGFGAASARRFVEAGAKVTVADINEDLGRRVAEELGAAAQFIRTDVTKEADVKNMVDATLAKFGGLHVMYNNAGATHVNQPLMDVTEKEFDLCYAVNVKAIYWSIRQVVPIFRKNGGGVILNTASTAGLSPRPGLTWYNSSKGAAVVLSKSLAVELARDNIRVNALCPVMGETGMMEKFMGVPDTPENRAKFTATIPLGRLSRPDDVAHAAVYLASDEAEFITGVALEIDGGKCV